MIRTPLQGLTAITAFCVVPAFANAVSILPERGEIARFVVEPAPLVAPVLDQHGTRVFATTARCPSYCTDFGASVRDEQVGESASSYVEMDQGSGNTARAFAQLTGGLQAPILKAESTGGSRTSFASAFGVQGYYYEGPQTEFTFNFNLTGEIGADNGSGTRDTQIQSRVALLEADPFYFTGDLATLVYEAGGRFLESVDDVNINRYLTARDPGAVDMSDSFTFSVDNGDAFYIWASLSTQALPGGTADAYNTLVTSITAVDGSDPVGLISASVLAGQVDLGNGDNGDIDPAPGGGIGNPAAVPTPATLALTLPMLLVFARRNRA